MEKYGKNLTRHENVWKYKIHVGELISSKICMEKNILYRRETIANFIGTRGHRIVETSVIIFKDIIVVEYKTKRISLWRRIKNIFG